MNDTGKKELNLLLNNFWITKEQNIEDYYNIKNKLNLFKGFVGDKLGCKIVITPKLIKLEKIPVYPSSYMGISTFDNKLHYILLTLILIFLEDKMDKESFILSNLIDYISNNALSLELNTLPNWDLFQHRKALITVLNFLVDLNIIRIKDVTNKTFIDDKNSDALYEATGLANYLIREFNSEIFNYQNISDFLDDEWREQTKEKGDVRRFKVYRNLLFSPVSYTDRLDASEVDYIRKFRGSIKNEIETYTDAELEVDKSMCLLLYDYESNQKNSFPNTKAISDIVLIVNNEINTLLENKTLELDQNEIITMQKADFLKLLFDIKLKYHLYLSKYFQDSTIQNFCNEVINYMMMYDFIIENNNIIKIYPMVLKIYGTIPEITVNNNVQLDLFGGNNE